MRLFNLNRWIPVFSVIVLLAACAQTKTVSVGDTQVQLVQLRSELNKNPRHFVHVHENETTALDAATRYIHSYGGTVLTLRHSGARNVVFHMDGKRYEVDPNRIYTDVGIEKSLKMYGAYSPKAHQAVKRLAGAIKALLPQDNIIAVHNNKGYSIRDYFPKHSLHGDAARIHYQPGSSARNFYFVTRSEEYKRLSAESFNIVLQAPQAQNDGSLSFYLAKKNYINIEAAYGDLNAQLIMLEHA